ncbi:hypothetical protein ACFLT1_09630 [Bacteroidota bacterium]
MWRTIFLTILIPVLLLGLSGCKSNDNIVRELEAEHISYKVSYMEKMAGDIPTRMLPDMMEAYYTKRYIKTSINGFFGQFSLVQIADLRKNTVTTLLNFLGSKVAYQGKNGEIPAGIVPLDNPTCTLTQDTLSISGIHSKKAIIETDNDQFTIYYTEELDIRNPNLTTPYYFIDFVLSDFRVQLSVLKMRLILDNHEQIAVEESQFQIPEDYTLVSRTAMESIINNLFTKD